MMMMQHTNDKRLALQEKALEQLEQWFENEIDQIEQDFQQDRITLAQYKRLIREADEAYQEDYADIFAG